MKALTLMQPWASALFIPVPYSTPKAAAKSWETRGWKPSKENQAIIREQGLLIHSSLGCDTQALKRWPFTDYIPPGMHLPQGAIIGIVKVGEIISTEAWKGRFEHFEDGAAERPAEEHAFGDYRPGRYAWQFTDFHKFDTPIPMMGKLSLWDVDMKIFDHPADVFLKIHRVWAMADKYNKTNIPHA